MQEIGSVVSIGGGNQNKQILSEENTQIGKDGGPTIAEQPATQNLANTPELAPGDYYVKGAQAARFGVTKSTLARWARIGAIRRYGTTRKALYRASEINQFLLTNLTLDGKPAFRDSESALKHFNRPAMEKRGELERAA